MKYERVDKAPEKLSEKEGIVEFPSFQEEIDKTRARSGKVKLTTANYLRSILIEIGFNHNETFNAYGINVSNCIGVAYKNDSDISSILTRLLAKQLPEVIEKRLKDQISKLPRDTEIIYFVADDLAFSSVFTSQGIEMTDSTPAKKAPSKKTESKK